MTHLVHPGHLDVRLVGLERPEHTGATAGLCRAVAERWKVDPLIVRVAVVALTFAGGVGIALYAWGWVLTPRTGGRPPIARAFPSFGTWSTTTQVLVISVSLLAVLLSGTSRSGVALGPVLLVAVVVWAVSRTRRPDPVDPAAPQTVPPTHSPVPEQEPDTVEQWRTRLAGHGGPLLPTVDLYAPDAPPPSPTPQRTGWWAAIVITLLSVLLGAVPFVLGLRPTVLWGTVAAGATAAVCLIIFSLAAGHRRIPGLLLVLALVGAFGSGLLAVQHSTAVSFSAGGSAHYSFVGDTNAHLDLSDESATAVTIDATASVVHVTMSAAPASIVVEGDAIQVDRQGVSGAAGDINLVLAGDFSLIDLEVTP